MTIIRSFRRSAIVLGLSAISFGCSDNGPEAEPDPLAIYAVTGCYFSELTEPVQIRSYSIETLGKVLERDIEFERTPSDDSVGSLVLSGTRKAIFEPESGKFRELAMLPRDSRGFGIIEKTAIEFSRCGETLCFDVPTIAGQERPTYERGECPSVDADGKPSL